MMMDSYNEYYKDKIKKDKLVTGSITAGERRKLFYQYTSGNYGYKVGPGFSNRDYYNYTEDNAVYTDPKIDAMYFPGSQYNYYLASPAALDSDTVWYIGKNFGGYVYAGIITRSAFCPLVSLKSSVQLEFAE